MDGFSVPRSRSISSCPPCPPCSKTMTWFLLALLVGVTALLIYVVYWKRHGSASGPPTVEELGRSGWTVLHSFATRYPDHPTKGDRERLLEFLNYFAKNYPCEKCSFHMMQYMDGNPPDASGNAAFQRWLCQFHNNVNKRLNKETFDCSLVEQKWDKSRPVCSDKCKLQKT